MRFLILVAIPIVLAGLAGLWQGWVGNDPLPIGTTGGENYGSSADFPLGYERGKLTGAKKAITKVVRLSEWDKAIAKMVIVVDEEVYPKEDADAFGLLTFILGDAIIVGREYIRYRVAESIFREAGGGEEGWTAVEKFLPESDTDTRFRALLSVELTEVTKYGITVWAVINWEKKKQ